MTDKKPTLEYGKAPGGENAGHTFAALVIFGIVASGFVGLAIGAIAVVAWWVGKMAHSSADFHPLLK